MTAIVYVCTLIGVSTPVANFNIGDSAILITAAMFNPLTAMIAGGLGAFLADLTTYPATMLYTLVIKAIEGLVAGIAFTFIYKRFDKIENPTKKTSLSKSSLRQSHACVARRLWRQAILCAKRLCTAQWNPRLRHCQKTLSKHLFQRLSQCL